MDFWHSDSAPEGQATSNRERLRRALWDLVETIVISFILFVAINLLTARIRVESISMEPNLYAGDFVIVNKVAYLFDEPELGDIIVFRFPPNPTETPYIKRIIGVPGDRVKIQNGMVFINDERIQEPYLAVGTYPDDFWVVPDESLFVMGDNRENSSDSRTWGMVPLDNVIGKAELVYWPPQDWQILNMTAAVAAYP